MLGVKEIHFPGKSNSHYSSEAYHTGLCVPSQEFLDLILIVPGTVIIKDNPAEQSNQSFPNPYTGEEPECPD